MVTSAVSPFQMYSSESADCGSIQPVPVLPMTTSDLARPGVRAVEFLDGESRALRCRRRALDPDVHADRLLGGRRR